MNANIGTEPPGIVVTSSAYQFASPPPTSNASPSATLPSTETQNLPAGHPPSTSTPPSVGVVTSEKSGDSTQKPPGQSDDNAEMAANTAHPSAESAPQTSAPPPLAASSSSGTPLDSSHKNTNLQGDANPSADPAPPALSLTPLAEPTISETPLDSSQENPHVQVDKPESETESDQGDDSAEPKTPKYKVGTFIIKEVDGIWCTGVIHRVVFEKKSFVYSLKLNEVDFEESIIENEIDQFVFVSDGWIVMKDLDVFVTVGSTDHPAKIDSMVRLSEELVDTKSLRVRWVINNQKSEVDISSVRPMYSTEGDKKRRSVKPSTSNEQHLQSTTSSRPQKSGDGLLVDSNCPRKLLVGLSYECKHYINCNSLFAKQKNAKMAEKSKRMPQQEVVTFRDNFRLFQQERSMKSSLSFQVMLTTGMELYKEGELIGSVMKECDRFAVKLSPQSYLAKCLCLMVYSSKNVESDIEVNMTEVPLVYGPLSSFIDRDETVDLELLCFSQMSITIIFFPYIKIHPVLLNFILDLFDLEKAEIDEKNYKHAMISVHGPSITEKSHLVQVLSSGYDNFLQAYDVTNGFIFASEFDKHKNLICHRSSTYFPTDETLDNFFHNLGVLFVSCASNEEVQSESMQTPYNKPVKKLLSEYLANRPTPVAFTWLNLYLEKIRSKIFSMDNLLHKFLTPEGQEGYGLYIASIFDSIYKFGGKHDRYRYHRMWACSNCSIETVCASAMVIYKHVLSGKYRFWCRCCEKDVHKSSSGQYNTLHDIMVAIPYVSLTHRLARRLRLSSELPIEPQEEFFYQGDFRLYPKHLVGMELDKSVMECIPDSSKLDKVIGDDSLLLSAIKNDAEERFGEATRTWKSIVTCIFGTDDDSSQYRSLGTDDGVSQNEHTLLLQQDDEAPQENPRNVTNLNIQQVPREGDTPNLQHDHQVLQEKIEKVMNGGDVNALFPVKHNEKFLCLKDAEQFEDDWKSELDHLEGLLASKAKSVTKVDWKNPEFPCHMPRDIHFLLAEGDIKHLNDILEDDQNDFKYFHQLGLLPAYLQVALEGSDDAHKYRRIPKVAHQFAFECSNGCENIFTKDGRSKIIRDSSVYVMTSEVTAANYKRLQDISAFLKGEEFYHLVADFPKKNKLVQWVACEEVQAYLEEDLEFFGALEHNVEKELPVKIKKKLKTHFTYLEKEYEKPKSFQLTLLQPYLSYLQLTADDNDNNCSFGFADTQMAISTALLFDTIPYMKTVERMTNPCFQNTDFASVMKGKHVTNTWEETMLDSVSEVSGSDKENVNEEENDEFNAGSDNGSVNDEVNQSNHIANDPIAILLSQATQESGQRISPGLQNQIPITGKGTKKRRPTPDDQDIRRGKRIRRNTVRFAPSSRKTIQPQKRGCAPDTDYSPPVVNSSILFPIRVTREKLNCEFGNTVNLLTYINHFNTGLKQKLLSLGAQKYDCCLEDIQTLMKHHCGYDVMVLPTISSYTELQSFVTELQLPMLVSLELDFRSIKFAHVIGISPYMSAETSQVEYHIIDGSHPEMKAIYFNQENIDWCCGNEISFTKITHGFVFAPGMKRVHEMIQDKSGYKFVPGTAVCLATSKRKRKRGEKKAMRMHRTDTTYEKMLTLNVYNKEKSEYVKIWKQLTDKYKKQAK